MQMTRKTRMNPIWILIVATGFFACNDSNSDHKANASGQNDTTVQSSADSSQKLSSETAKTTPKSKKGKMSITMPVSSQEKIVKDKEGVYNRTEVMPEFPGGQNALANYIDNHVEYPQQAIDDNREGVIRVSFVVDEQGKVKDAKLIGNQKLGSGLDEEALRTISQMPDWKPGKVKGRNVKSRLELPISFQLTS